MSPVTKFAIVIGSTRPNRVGPLIARWVLNILQANEAWQNIDFSILDLASFSLPSFNEPTHPMMIKNLDHFSSPTVIAWNQEIAKFDAYILISPEYHSGIPGALKNAIDFLYVAWTGKPVMILTYGVFGGAHANSQLRQVLGLGCRMQVASIDCRLEFPGRDEEQNNTSPALSQAMAGNIETETFDFWKDKEDQILSGAHEMLASRGI